VPPDGPFVLVEKVRGALRIMAVDSAARALGITPGLTLADARACAPGLGVLPHDPAADMMLLEWVADGCDRYTPMVALDLPQGLVLDITGCGKEADIAADVEARLAKHGLSTQFALANTPDAAIALAQFSRPSLPLAALREARDSFRAKPLSRKEEREQIANLPITALRIAPETHIALRRAGLYSIGDLATRPMAPLAARFGAELPALLARILGKEDVRITPRRLPPALIVEQRFAEPIARTADMLSTIEDLAKQAATTLSEHSDGGRRFEASLFRSDGHVARLAIETGAPTRDAKLINRLFGERIDNLNDPLDPGFGYDLIRLAVPVTEPLGAQQLRLEGGSVAQAEMAALIDRLGVRLGAGRLRRLAAGDSHVPEQAVLELPFADTPPRHEWKPLEAGEPPLRPIHLFDPPQRIEVLAEVPDGPPRRFRWRRLQHDVTRYEGPERIAAQWWLRADGTGLTRDYFRVEDKRGQRFWLFRHGLYGDERANPDWYVHGVFA
jgi:protein ImuB